MIKRHTPILIGVAYPIVSGGGYRCFDGERWYDCDKYGKIKGDKRK